MTESRFGGESFWWPQGYRWWNFNVRLKFVGASWWGGCDVDPLKEVFFGPLEGQEKFFFGCGLGIESFVVGPLTYLFRI